MKNIMDKFFESHSGKPWYILKPNSNIYYIRVLIASMFNAEITYFTRYNIPVIENKMYKHIPARNATLVTSEKTAVLAPNTYFAIQMGITEKLYLIFQCPSVSLTVMNWYSIT